MNNEARKRYEQELIEETNRLMEEINKDPALKGVKVPAEARENIFKAIREKEHEREVIEEADRLIEEINKNPKLRDVKVPEDAFDNIMKAIREKEAEREIENMSEENKELIRLGKIYQRKRGYRKYLVLAATMVCVFAFEITSLGGPEKVFETVRRYALGREQTKVNSNEDVIEIEDWSEDKAYEEIEEKYGFYPVKLNYRPEGVEFQEVSIGDKIQGINLVYGHEEKADIFFMIRPNFRTGSLGIDIEDEKIQEYQITVRDTDILLAQYKIEGSGENRWYCEFEYQDVHYLIQVFEMEKEEVEEIVKNLYFPKI